MNVGLHVKYPLFSSEFIKIHPVGAELFRVDRHTGMKKLIYAVCNFVNAPENSCQTLISGSKSLCSEVR